MSSGRHSDRLNILMACALEYKEGMRAPIVSAFGKGEMAHKILQLARKYNIPVEQEQVPGMLANLEQVKIRAEIPPELYLAVARIFAFIHTRGRGRGGVS